VFVTLVLACCLGFAALQTLPHQARLERWLERQPGVASARVSTGPERGASDSYSTASAGLDRELTSAAFSRFASAYESYSADHAWALDWGLTVSHDQVSVPVSTDHGANTATARMLTLVATDPHVVRVRFEDRYLFAVVIESVDPLATRALLAPVLGDLPTTRVVGPGETLHP
jgi:hypothetical protein